MHRTHILNCDRRRLLEGIAPHFGLITDSICVRGARLRLVQFRAGQIVGKAWMALLSMPSVRYRDERRGMLAAWRKTRMLTADAFSAGRTTDPRAEATFFGALRLANGTSKKTSDRRMDDVNEFVLARWNATMFRPRIIMDVAISSGISTVEWIDCMSRAGLQVHMTATDLALWGRIVSPRRGITVLEAGGCALQYVFYGVPIRPWRRRLDYLTGYALINMLARRIAARRQSGSAEQRVLLVSPRARQHPGIQWLEDDVLAANPEQFLKRFDVIRAANILNHVYFQPEQLRRAVSNLKARLAGPDARLIINRTWPDGTNHATMFRLTGANSFEVDGRFGQGSEIEDIVLASRES